MEEIGRTKKGSIATIANNVLTKNSGFSTRAPLTAAVLATESDVMSGTITGATKASSETTTDLFKAWFRQEFAGQNTRYL